LNKSHFLATSRPSTRTVSSPRLASTTSTSRPGSCRSVAARLAAYSRVPPQTGHCRIVTFFIGHSPFRPAGYDHRENCTPPGPCRAVHRSCGPGAARAAGPEYDDSSSAIVWVSFSAIRRLEADRRRSTRWAWVCRCR
jgi:hypothetical protein